jgi:putative ABC transport system substrate-binding protein
MKSHSGRPARRRPLERHEFLEWLGAGLLSLPAGAAAHETRKVPRVGVLAFTETSPALQEAFRQTLVAETREAATAGHLRLSVVDVRKPEDLPSAFSELVKQRAGAAVVDAALTPWQAADLALRHRVPSVSNQRRFAESGGLMSHAAVPDDIYRRAASYVDKILKGADPAGLPVERPTRFELVFNLKTAKALGVTVPSSLLARSSG